METTERKIGQPRRNISLTELVEELDRQFASKDDFVVDSRDLLAVVDPHDGVMLRAVRNDEAKKGNIFYGINPWGHRQLSEKCDIPLKYYERMQNEGQHKLLADNINAWLGSKERRMIRTLDGKVRAVLSDRYLPLDNIGVAKLLFEQLAKHNLNDNDPSVVRSCHLSETRMYIQANVPYMEAEIRSGDKVIQGVILTNSEVGASSFKAEPFLYRLVCSNGLIGAHKLARVHLGSRQDVGAIMSERTTILEDELLRSKLTDIVESVFDPDVFHSWVDQLQQTTEVGLPAPSEAIDNVIKLYNVNESLKDFISNSLIAEGDPTQYGLVNAITRSAQQTESFETQIELEKVAGEISLMERREFENKIATMVTV